MVPLSAVIDERFYQAQMIQALPKFNSHCHLGGEIPLHTLEKYATAEQLEAIQKGLAEIAKGKEYEKAFFIFPLISQIINTHEKLREATYQTCERMKEDNNQFVLLRTGLKQIESKSFEEYLQTVLGGIQQATTEHFSVGLMLSLKRSSPLETAKLTVDLALKYREHGVIGIDISDKSVEGDITTIMPQLLRAKQKGLKIAVHMGESDQEKDQMVIVHALQPDIIDHGVNLCKEARKWAEQNRTLVTVCLTSAEATKMHPEGALHPWVLQHLKNGHPIDLGTDDATVFGNISLSSEYLRLQPHLDFEKIAQVAKESFQRAKSLLRY